ncbi:unnamed protein product [Sphagnum troendelagicum]|uniref:Secreted protein n=1 Tax=Sphagnum troendelagicum TaxID=128251 RepID=A0ABP0USV3_9BRYO
MFVCQTPQRKMLIPVLKLLRLLILGAQVFNNMSVAPVVGSQLLRLILTAAPRGTPMAVYRMRVLLPAAATRLLI